MYRFLLLVLAVTGGLLLLVPYIRSGDPFHPLAFVGLGYALGVGGPMIDIALTGTSFYSNRLFGNQYEYLLFPSVVSVLSIISLLIGYYSRIRVDSGRFPHRYRWNKTTARIVILVFSAIGVVFSGIFVATTGGIPQSLADLSVRGRSPPTHYISWGAQFLFLAALLGWVNYAQGDNSSYFIILLWFITLGSFILPVYTSNRGQLMYTAIAFLMIYHYQISKLRIILLSTVGFCSLFIINMMSVLRRYAQQAAYGEPDPFSIADILVPADALRSVFGANYGNFVLDSHIINKTGQAVSYKYGESLFRWIVFPIPRSVWEEKPVQLGGELAVEIYSRPSTATPPTLIGELYLNYSIIGVILGMAVFGIFVGCIHHTFKNTKWTNPSSLLVYIIVCITLLQIPSVTPVMVSFLLRIVPILVAIFIINGYIHEIVHRAVSIDLSNDSFTK